MTKPPEKKSSARESYGKWRWVQRLGGGYLAKILVHNVWFRYAFLTLVAGGLAGFLFLLKIWRVTPDGFIPVVRISGLDMLQAASLRRTARQHLEAGRFPESAYCWAAAIANNVGDVSLHREALAAVPRYGRPDAKLFSRHANSMFWLLRLTGTNRQDLALVARVAHSQRMDDLVFSLLRPQADDFKPEEQALYLKSLFHTGQAAAFGETLAKAEKNPDPELPLYRAAYRLGWGAPGEASAARTLLEQAVAAPATKELATRLWLPAAFQREDVERYERLLQSLEADHADTLADHLPYWRMLIVGGRKAGAVPLIKANTREPATAAELLVLTEWYWEFDNRDRALDLFRQHAPRFAGMPEMWISHGNLLAQHAAWEELRQLAVEVREQSLVNGVLEGHSYFLEGWAEHGMNRITAARLAIKKASEARVSLPGVALRDATIMAQLGYAAESRALLERLAGEDNKNPEFWAGLFQAAYEANDEGLLRAAAVKGLALQPDNASFVNNYAAALLVNRGQVTEALRHTMRLYAAAPKSLASQFNHGFALLLNGRTDEAAAIFKTVNTRPLNRRQNSFYQLAWFEIYLNQKDYVKAREAADKIDPAHLFPSQLQWFQAARKQLPPAGAPG